MTNISLYQFLQHKQRYAAVAAALLFIAVNVSIDFLFTWLRNSAFYFSESLLFSSYWLLFLPALLLLARLVNKTSSARIKIILTVSTLLAHLAFYPFLIWLLSALLHEHTYAYRQTFSFALSTYFIQSAIIYGGWLLFAFLRNKKTMPAPGGITSLIVADSNNRRQVLALKEVLFFSANPPYVNIHQPAKKYLHTGTLKSLQSQLDARQFVRIHKSCIVNIREVASIRSRQNGDYDAMLSDGSVVRVSRNYAKQFNAAFTARTQLTTV